jgi:DNA-binding NarL/FixJ family response regulator
MIACGGRRRSNREGSLANDTVYVVDPHAIYRSGVVSVLERMQEIGAVGQTESVEDARADADLLAADVVIVDHDLAGARDLIRELRSGGRVHVFICSAHCAEQDVRASIRSGATGVLCKDTLTPEGLQTALRAADNGAGIVPPDLLEALSAASQDPAEAAPPRGPTTSRLTERERRVLRLIADGNATREVAGALAYSERTVKSVLHDAVTKLGARSRSQAVAYAVRHGLI